MWSAATAAPRSAAISQAYERNERLGLVSAVMSGDRGTSGCDLIELPWTADWPAEKAFFLAVLDLAVGRYRWDELGYDPPHAHDYVTRYRDMVAGFAQRPTLSGDRPDGVDWLVPPDPEDLRRCERHGLYVGYYTGCRLEDG